MLLSSISINIVKTQYHRQMQEHSDDEEMVINAESNYLLVVMLCGADKASVAPGLEMQPGRYPRGCRL